MATKSKIQDQTFLFTGTLTEFTRDEAEALVETHGGKVLSGVSAKLNYLVVGADAGSKLDKAKALGTVKILTEKEFLKMVPKAKSEKKTESRDLTIKNSLEFKRMTIEEFKIQWPQEWMNYNTYTRILLVIDAELKFKKQILKFVEEKPFLKLELIQTAKEKTFDIECDLFWVYIHSNSEFRYLNEDLITFSGLGDGINIEAIDIDNRILQKYSYGDSDTGMFDEIDPEDFVPNKKINKDYYKSLDNRIINSPVTIIK